MAQVNSSSAIDAQASGLAEFQVDNYLQTTEVPGCLYVASIHVYQYILALSTTDAAAPNGHLEVSPLNILREKSHKITNLNKAVFLYGGWGIYYGIFY